MAPRVTPAPFEEGDLYVGIDESNHGRFPEIFVAVFSQFPTDTSNNFKLSKRRSKISPMKCLEKRAYTFLVALEGDYQRIPSRQLIGVVTSSLVYSSFTNYLDHLKIFLDGEKTPGERTFTRDLVSEVCDFDRNRVLVFSGARFDQTFPLVNLADSVAYHLFKRYSLENLSKNPNRRYLLC